MSKTFGNAFARAKKILKNLKDQAERLRQEETELRAAEKELALAATSSSGSSEKTLDISTTSVVKATLAIFGLVALAWFVLAIQHIIILFLIAAFLAVAFDPFVDRLQGYGVPRGVGILLIYIAFFTLLGILVSSFVPILTTEIPNLLSQTLGWVQTSFGVDTSLIRDQVAELQNYLSSIQSSIDKENVKFGLDLLSVLSQNALVVVKSVAGGVFTFGLVLVITFFMVVEENGIKQFLIALFPRRYHRYIIEKATTVEDKFGSWLRGQIILMVVVGLVTFIALKIVGVNYAATLGTLASFTELIPYVGPLIALLPALIIAASQGGIFLLLVVIAIYVAIQQLEGNILVPLVMERAVGLSPVVIMFAMLVGASFPAVINPIVGIILSVPVTTAIAVFVQDYAERRK
jgi:predicted PurR-regulated permease PerM